VLWPGSIHPEGYGTVYVYGKQRPAHRVAYATAHNLTLDDLSGLDVHARRAKFKIRTGL
jgi:hypothetical protein